MVVPSTSAPPSCFAPGILQNEQYPNLSNSIRDHRHMIAENRGGVWHSFLLAILPDGCDTSTGKKIRTSFRFCHALTYTFKIYITYGRPPMPVNGTIKKRQD
jgi:hypothetical protein